MALIEYIQAFAVRGACTCGRCCDSGPAPKDDQPNGHTVNMYFFEVAAKHGADANALRTLIAEHTGIHRECNPLDGSEHSYIDIGGWIGDQGLALTMMGLGAVLGLWKILTPKMLPGLDDNLMAMMAGQGMVSIIPNPTDSDG